MEMVFKIWKITAMACGGLVGWMIGEFKPAFPLAVVAVVFILYDAWTAYKLDKRVHNAYPDKTQRKQAKFTSFAFGKVVKQTIPKRLMLIIPGRALGVYPCYYPFVVCCYRCNLLRTVLVDPGEREQLQTGI